MSQELLVSERSLFSLRPLTRHKTFDFIAFFWVQNTENVLHLKMLLLVKPHVNFFCHCYELSFGQKSPADCTFLIS